ncbi:MAG: hypothetical protein AAFZ65_17135 [Planctomycetota bacterium]
MSDGDEQSSTPAPLSWRDRGLFAALCAVVALALAGPIRSGDLWWHLRTGHWILDNGRLPQIDPFSHTAGDEHWILQEYGTQVLLALVESASGIGGIRVAGALLGVLLLVAVLGTARRAVQGPWAVALTALFATLFALKWELRPHLLSAFFVLRLHQLLFDARAARAPSNRTLLELFVLSAIWVQLHAEALFAPIFAFAGFLGALLTVTVRRPKDVAPLPHLTRWAGAFAATLGGTLCSPLGLEPHVYALFRRSVPKDYIEEWFPAWIFPGDPRFAPLDLSVFFVVAASLIGTGVLGLIWGARRFGGRARTPRFEALGFLGTCGALAFDARRFFWLLWFPLRERASEVRTPAALAPWVSLLLISIVGRSHFAIGAVEALRDGRFVESVDPDLFPVGSAEVIGAAGLEGNLYHPYEWGGYLGWVLGDANPVYIDGRTVLFEDVIPERWRVERWRMEGDPSFARETLADRDVRVIVFKRLVNRDGAVRPWRPPGADAEWIRAHADATSEVWLRADQTEALEQLRDWYADRDIPFDAGVGYVELAALARGPRALAERPLPAEVLERLRPTLEPLWEAGDPDAELAAWQALERRCSELRVGRSARYAAARVAELTATR